MIIGMRDFAQSWVMKIVLGGIVVTFIGAFGVVRLSATKQVLATVGSHEILLLDYNVQYQRALDDLRQRFPENADTVANQLNRTLSERESAEAAERAAKIRFRSILDNAVFGIFLSTLDGRFLDVNPALVSM